MIRSITTVLILISSIFWSACLDTIEFDTPDEFQDAIAIIGKIVKGNPSTVEVSVQNLFDFSFEESAFINAVRVAIVDEEGRNLELPISGPGEYKLSIESSSDFKVEIGSSYRLEVDLFDGRSFESDYALLRPVPKMESFEPKLVNKEVLSNRNEFEIESRIEYRVSTSLLTEFDESKTNLKWDFTRTYKLTDNTDRVCYATTIVDADLIQLVKAEELSIDNLRDYLILEQRLSQQMVEGQYVFVIQESIDNRTAEFWQQVQDISTNSGTFYEPPPGQIITNLRSTTDEENLIFGYFYATEQDTLSVYIDADFINRFIPFCPRPPPCCMVCEECCDCTQFFPTTKPDFWTE